jgi:predicted RND superfamily exporter protein
MNTRDSTAPRRAAQTTPDPAIALGVERFGLIPLRAPILSIMIALVLAAAAVFGIQRIETDDSLSQLFRSDTPAFKQFEQVSRQFPSSE